MSSFYKQRGFGLLMQLILVAAFVFIIVLSAKNQLPIFGSFSGIWKTFMSYSCSSYISSPQSSSSTANNFSTNTSTPTRKYVVQVFSSYHSKQAYALKQNLQQDGYNVQIENSERSDGMIFKVLLGPYSNKDIADQERESITRRYQKLSDGFVRRL